jgi:hypothetical protein
VAAVGGIEGLRLAMPTITCGHAVSLPVFAAPRAVASHFCAQGELMNFAPPPKGVRRPTSKMPVRKNFDDLFFSNFSNFFHTPPTTPPPTLHSPCLRPWPPPFVLKARPPPPAPRATALVAPPFLRYWLPPPLN